MIQTFHVVIVVIAAVIFVIQFSGDQSIYMIYMISAQLKFNIYMYLMKNLRV